MSRDLSRWMPWVKTLSDRIIITRETLKKNLDSGKGQEYLICARYDEKRMTQVHLERESSRNILGNIYIGRVVNIVENLQAAFIEIEKGFACFYSLTDLKNPVFTKKNGKKPLCIGDELLVEVTKERIKTKPPMVSTNLNFPGKYLVLTTENQMLGTSRKLQAEDRNRLKQLLEPHVSSEEFGVVIRTNARDAGEEEILAELEALKKARRELLERARHLTAFSLLRASVPYYLSFIQGLQLTQVEKITTDIPEVYEELALYFREYEKQELQKLYLYEDSMVSLSALYSLKHELDRAMAKKVWLPSGGYLVIEPTEALTVIDVNSGKDIRKKSKEELIFSINMEAAQEIGRQLMLRNISGICVVDFIDMKRKEHQEKLLSSLRKILKMDKNPATLVDITRLGLVELTRKRVEKSLREQLEGDEPHEK